MSSTGSESLPLIQTKLHRPLVPVDLGSRPQLTGWLDERRNRPLTLVSVPAGYGKSAVINRWLAHFMSKENRKVPMESEQ